MSAIATRTIPSEAAIAAEVATLLMMQISCEDAGHARKIEHAQDALAGGLTYSQVWERYEAAGPGEMYRLYTERDAALLACDWLAGETTEKPSSLLASSL